MYPNTCIFLYIFIRPSLQKKQISATRRSTTAAHSIESKYVDAEYYSTLSREIIDGQWTRFKHRAGIVSFTPNLPITLHTLISWFVGLSDAELGGIYKAKQRRLRVKLLHTIAATNEQHVILSNELKRRIDEVQLQSEEVKKTAEEELRLINRAFTRNIMHNLRSPLFCLSLGIGTTNPAELSMCCDSMTDTLNNYALYEDSLRLSSDIVNRTYFNASDMLLDVVNGLPAQANLAEVIIRTDLVKDEARVFMESSNIRQALRNVLVDAIKFTPKGGTISVRTTMHESLFRVDISNSGRALDVEALTALNLMQFDPAVLEGAHGSSLGMHVAKKVVENHAGRIGAYSTVDPPVTSFFLELPLSTDKVTMSNMFNNLMAKVFQPPRVSALVVDDAPLCRKFIIRQLAAHCTAFAEAGNGLEAYELVCASLQVL